MKTKQGNCLRMERHTIKLGQNDMLEELDIK